MSDAIANTAATPRSARAAALARRQALSQNGRAALPAKPPQAARPVAATAPRPAQAAERVPPAVSVPSVMALPAGLSGKSLSRARREALSQGGRAALAQSKTSAPAVRPATVHAAEPAALAEAADRDCGCKGKDKLEGSKVETEQTLDAVCSLVESEVVAPAGSAVSAVRKLCQARRGALASQGKTAVTAEYRTAASAQRSNGKSGLMTGLSGRDAARARRAALSHEGRGDSLASRPAGRVRPQAPGKVEVGTTLTGTSVTGTQVERTGKVTGNEPGSCRVITGTEYIGAEQYEVLCSVMPTPAPAKVSISNTGRGQRVSGAGLYHSEHMTGDEAGTCKPVTGTEYLSADKFESFCAAKPLAAPAKVNLASTQAGLSVSGTLVGRNPKVTGDEPGSCNSKLTGSQYAQDQSVSACRSGNNAPHKVSVMSTVKQQAVTGTDVASSELITGAERGACAAVTGTESNGLAQYQACSRAPQALPEKVGLMRTRHDQQVSGTLVEQSSKVTGGEQGGTQMISGTEYINTDPRAGLNDVVQQQASRALMVSRSAQAGVALRTPRSESGDAVTGAERGESQVLSGTPYAGTYQRVSQRGANSNPHPLSRAATDAPRIAALPEPVAPVRGEFSIATPSRTAQDSNLSRITGTAYGAVGRITGPVNLAAGLVSGTPEFRHQEGTSLQMVARASTPVADDMRSRLTGDGREGGFAITGAAWRRNESVTGTEGDATHRNPTLRGEQRSPMVGAAQLKDREKPALPMSRITGSSGNDAKGSAITYSGGARG